MIFSRCRCIMQSAGNSHRYTCFIYIFFFSHHSLHARCRARIQVTKSREWNISYARNKHDGALRERCRAATLCVFNHAVGNFLFKATRNPSGERCLVLRNSYIKSCASQFTRRFSSQSPAYVFGTPSVYSHRMPN